MEFGYASVRRIEQLCKTDIRFMWLLQDEPAPSHMTIDNFMNETLLGNIKDIFTEINEYIFSKEKVDTNHIYIGLTLTLIPLFQIKKHPRLTTFGESRIF